MMWMGRQIIINEQLPIEFQHEMTVDTCSFGLTPNANVPSKQNMIVMPHLIIEFCHKRKLVGLDKLDDFLRRVLTIIIIATLVKLRKKNKHFQS